MPPVQRYGDRFEVWAGTAVETRGGLRKEDLIINGNNRLVSRNASSAAQLRYQTSDQLREAMERGKKKVVRPQKATAYKSESESSDDDSSEDDTSVTSEDSDSDASDESVERATPKKKHRRREMPVEASTGTRRRKTAAAAAVPNLHKNKTAHHKANARLKGAAKDKAKLSGSVRSTTKHHKK